MELQIRSRRSRRYRSVASQGRRYSSSSSPSTSVPLRSTLMVLVWLSFLELQNLHAIAVLIFIFLQNLRACWSELCCCDGSMSEPVRPATVVLKKDPLLGDLRFNVRVPIGMIQKHDEESNVARVERYDRGSRFPNNVE
jgi:hypothetical protein